MPLDLCWASEARVIDVEQLLVKLMMILILLLATRDSGKSRIWHRQEGKCGKGLEIEGVLEGESLDEPIVSTEDRRGSYCLTITDK